MNRGQEFSVFRRKTGQLNTDMRSKVTFFNLFSQRGTGWSVVGYPGEGEPLAEVQIRDWGVALQGQDSPAEEVAPIYSRAGSVAMLEVRDPQAAIAGRREYSLMVRADLATARSHPSAVERGLHTVLRAVVLTEDVTELRTTESC
jgi:hypothetical protein